MTVKPEVFCRIQVLSAVLIYTVAYLQVFSYINFVCHTVSMTERHWEVFEL